MILLSKSLKTHAKNNNIFENISQIFKTIGMVLGKYSLQIELLYMDLFTDFLEKD